MEDYTVAQAIAKLLTMPPESKLRVWLPGQHIVLSEPFEMVPGYVYFEGNHAEIQGVPKGGDE